MADENEIKKALLQFRKTNNIRSIIPSQFKKIFYEKTGLDIEGHCYVCGKRTKDNKRYCDEHKEDDFLKLYFWDFIRFDFIMSRLKNDVCYCEVCGKELKYYNYNYDNQIIVHHKIPLYKGGTNDYNNLMIVCNACHKKIHKEMREKEKKEKESKNKEIDKRQKLITDFFY